MADGVEVYTDDSGRITVYVSTPPTLATDLHDIREMQVQASEYSQATAEFVGELLQMSVILLGVLLAFIITRGGGK